jgi:hypothetical protein
MLGFSGRRNKFQPFHWSHHVRCLCVPLFGQEGLSPMIPATGRSAAVTDSDQLTPIRQDSPGGIRGALASLFPAAPARAVPLAWSRRVLLAAVQIAAVVIGAVVLLLRVPGIPSWDAVYAEDYFVYLPWAIMHPWHVFVAFDGYENLVPRLIAQFVTYLPTADAAKGFAVSGAIVAGLCALFTFHGSSGHIRSVTLRALLAVAVILLSSAPMEIADSGVNTLWYLLPALFWAVLWRPRTRTGIAVAALVGFFAAASTSLVILYAPLLAIRVFALRRVRDHAVTAGWLAGCLVQVRFVVAAALSGSSRLVGGGGPAFGRDNRWGNSITFYLHDVVLRSAGWHLSWWLQSHTSTNRATLIVGVALAVVLAMIIATQPGTRPFIVVAMLTGFVVVMFSIFLDPWDVVFPVTFKNEVAARYTALPILLIEASLIVAVDHALRSRRESGAQRAPGQWPSLTSLRPVLAGTLLAGFLMGNWVADFRYYGIRSGPAAHEWAPVATEWRYDCQMSPTGEIATTLAKHKFTIPCDRLKFLRLLFPRCCRDLACP